MSPEAGSVLITGGTSGLGRRTAAVLVRDPSWHVIITGRDAARTAAAAHALGAEGLALDLGSLADVRRFAERLREGERPPLRALVCNAGLQLVGPPRLSADGYEATFAVNHLGHFLLVALLLERLERPASVVIVSSDTHDPTQRTGMPAPRYTTAAELAAGGDAWAGGDSTVTAGRRRYTTSKLCNMLFVYELERRLGGRGLSFSGFDPGLMPGTGLARDYPAYQRLAWRYLMPALAVVAPGINTPRRSARALARLLGDPPPPSGRYWSRGRELPSSAESHDEAAAADLWQTSLELAGLAEFPGIRAQ